jgi:Lrp/AsnC family transcriptional regulator
MANELDEADRRLLRAVQADSSRSAAELASIVSLSQPACWRRLQRLRSDRYILRETALLDRTKLGLSTQVFASVKLSTTGRQHLADFATAVRNVPEVVECHVLMGAADFLLRVIVPDINAYERLFFENLCSLPGVQDVTSSVALSEIKPMTGVPL